MTGTSGKTTTTRMIESIFDAGGEPVGLIGTIEYRAGNERLVADRTTPDAVVLQQWFAKMRDAGVSHAVMEVSSHALALKRADGIRTLLREDGLTDAEIERLHAPIGLDIGGREPEEIALSIAAQLIAVREDKPIARR